MSMIKLVCENCTMAIRRRALKLVQSIMEYKMNLNDEIVTYGTKAVLRYRDVAGISYDNEVPEIYVGSFIARGIYDNLKMQAHVERYYTTIAQEFRIEIDQRTVNSFGSYKADVAAYQNIAPKAIIELKKFDENKSLSKIVADRDKMSKLSTLCPIKTYLGVLVTDAQNGRSYMDRIRALEEALGRTFDVVGKPQLAVDGKWKWCFASMRTDQR